MKTNKIIFLPVLLILSLILFIFQNQVIASSNIEKNAGTVSGIFLRLGMGVRAIGMGNSYTAIGDGLNATYGNPAGVINIDRREINVLHCKWLADIDYGYVGLAQPITNNSAIGMSILYVDYGNFEGRDVSGMLIAPPEASSRSIALTYGGKVLKNILAGINMKYVKETLDDIDAKTFSFDAGALIKTNVKGLFLGIAVQNLGRGLKFVKQRFSLPQTIRIGAMYKFYQDKFITSMDLVKAKDSDVSISMGVEVTFKNSVSLRTGYTSENDIGSGMTAGLGIYISKFIIDYGYAPFGELGDTHRFSLTYRF